MRRLGGRQRHSFRCQANQPQSVLNQFLNQFPCHNVPLRSFDTKKRGVHLDGMGSKPSLRGAYTILTMSTTAPLV